MGVHGGRRRASFFPFSLFLLLAAKPSTDRLARPRPSLQARDHLKMLLSRRDKSLRDVVAVLDEYRDNIGVDDDLSEDAPPSEGEERRAILDQLARYLESVA